MPPTDTFRDARCCERFRAGQDDGVEERRQLFHAGGNVPAAILREKLRFRHVRSDFIPVALLIAANGFTTLSWKGV